MLLRPTAVAKLRSEWTGVIKMRDRMSTLVTVTFASGAITGPALRNVVYNLPLLLAFDVLNQALAEARNENLFACSGNRPGLTKLMHCGKDSLPWIDWGALRKGVQYRNAVAHDGELFDAKQCLQYIASVEAQLLAWEIIDAT